MLADDLMLNERDVAGAMPEIREPALPAARHSARPAARPEPPTGDLDAVERGHIVRVLAETRGNKMAAARRLGISRRTLYRRLERHGLAKD
jgi:transcriptional regulator of acetoin/glycerol metabolism